MTTVMSVFSSLIGGLGDVVSVVTANDIMLIGVAATIGGIAISWFKRLTGQRRGGRK